MFHRKKLIFKKIYFIFIIFLLNVFKLIPTHQTPMQNSRPAKFSLINVPPKILFLVVLCSGVSYLFKTNAFNKIFHYCKVLFINIKENKQTKFNSSNKDPVPKQKKDPDIKIESENKEARVPVISKSTINKIYRTNLEWIKKNLDTNFIPNTDFINDLIEIMQQTKKHFLQQAKTVTSLQIFSCSKSLVFEFLLLKIIIKEKFPIKTVFINNLSNDKQKREVWSSQFEKIVFTENSFHVPRDNNGLLLNLESDNDWQLIDQAIQTMQGTNSIFFDSKKPNGKRFIYANIVPLLNEDKIDTSDQSLKEYSNFITNKKVLDIVANLFLYKNRIFPHITIDTPIPEIIIITKKFLEEYAQIIASISQSSIQTNRYIRNIELLKEQWNEIIDYCLSENFKPTHNKIEFTIKFTEDDKKHLNKQKFTLIQGPTLVENIHTICTKNVSFVKENLTKIFSLDDIINEISMVIQYLEKNKVPKDLITKFYGLGSGRLVFEFFLLKVLYQFGYTHISNIFIADLEYNQPREYEHVDFAVKNFCEYFSTMKVNVYNNTNKIPPVKNEKDEGEALIIAQSPNTDAIYKEETVRIMIDAPKSILFTIKNSTKLLRTRFTRLRKSLI